MCPLLSRPICALATLHSLINMFLLRCGACNTAKETFERKLSARLGRQRDTEVAVNHRSQESCWDFDVYPFDFSPEF